MMRQDRFTEQAQKVLTASQELVRQTRQSQWDVEHVLLALATESGLAADLLKELRVDAKRLATQVQASIERATRLGQEVVQVYTTPRVVTMLERANVEAERLKDEYVGVEHLLIAIAGVSNGPQPYENAASILAEHSITQERIYKALQQIRGSHRVTEPTAESRYQSLRKYTTDLTQLARDGKLDPVIGREVEIRRVMQILNRRTKNNPVIIGEAGGRQDRGRGRVGTAHRGGRRAGKPARQARAGAGYGPAPGRRQVPRRIRGAAHRRDGGGAQRRGARSSS